MNKINTQVNDLSTGQQRSPEKNLEERVKPSKRSVSRRAFLGKSFAFGAGTIGVGLLTGPRTAKASGGLPTGDAALLRFAAAAEYSRPTFGSNTTNSAASKMTKFLAAKAIKPTWTPWRLLRMKCKTTSMTTPMMRLLITSS